MPLPYTNAALQTHLHWSQLIQTDKQPLLELNKNHTPFLPTWNVDNKCCSLSCQEHSWGRGTGVGGPAPLPLPRRERAGGLRGAEEGACSAHKSHFMCE